jgi:hypothetical protein
MILDWESFNEGKNYSDLYHFTNIVSLVNILLDGYLKSEKHLSDIYDNDNPWIVNRSDVNNRLYQLVDKFDKFLSTTRNKNMYQNHWLSDIPTIRIKLDSSITNNYKVVPVNYFYNKADSDIKENEEAILFKKGKDKLNLKYVKEIDIIKNDGSDDFYKCLGEDLSSRVDYTIDTIENLNRELYNIELDYGIIDDFTTKLEYYDKEGMLEIYNFFFEYIKSYCKKNNIKIGYLDSKKIKHGNEASKKF